MQRLILPSNIHLFYIILSCIALLWMFLPIQIQLIGEESVHHYFYGSVAESNKSSISIALSYHLGFLRFYHQSWLRYLRGCLPIMCFRRSMQGG